MRSAPAAVIAVFYSIALPLCLSNYDHGRAYSDQLTYHLPAIEHFMRGGGVADYPAATTPGYHLLLAAVARESSSAGSSVTERTLKLFNSILTAALLGTMAAAVARRLRSASTSVVLLLPMICSIYILPAGVWLLPDNFAWLTVLAVVLLSLRFRDEWHWYGLAALALSAAVIVRQSNLWLCVVVLAAASSGDGRCTTGIRPPTSDAREAQDSTCTAQRPARRTHRVTAALLTIAPPTAIVAYFVRLWHGLTPPSFAERHTGLNLAAAPFLLALFFCYSVFYLPLVLNRMRDVFRSSTRVWRFVALGGLCGLVLSVLAPTDWDPAAGRVSGLWNLARLSPDLMHRAASMSVLATLGGMLGAVWMLLVTPASRIVMTAVLVGFTAAQTTSHFAYERYYAGLVFIVILLLTAEALRNAQAPTSARWRSAGPLVFALINAVVLYEGLARS